MDAVTQTETGFLVHHFCGGTPIPGGWEYQPTPVGLKIITPQQEWKGSKGGLERKGKWTQTVMKRKTKEKGIQTMEVDEEEKRRWEIEREVLEKRGKEIIKEKEERKIVNKKWLIEIEREKARSNRDRYREWIIRCRMRMKAERDEELKEAAEELQRWVHQKEREFEVSELLGEMIGHIESQENILTPPELLAPMEVVDENSEESGLLEEVLSEIRGENLAPPAAPTRPKIVEDIILKVPVYIKRIDNQD